MSKSCSCHPFCCHPFCDSCSQVLVSREGDFCAACQAIDLHDAGQLSDATLELVLKAHQKLEQEASRCPECEGGPCFNELCLDCQGEEMVERSIFERSHGAGSI